VLIGRSGHCTGPTPTAGTDRDDQIYPEQRNNALIVQPDQVALLRQFAPER
jgi:hypothetical protein